MLNSKAVLKSNQKRLKMKACIFNRIFLPCPNCLSITLQRNHISQLIYVIAKFHRFKHWNFDISNEKMLDLGYCILIFSAVLQGRINKKVFLFPRFPKLHLYSSSAHAVGWNSPLPPKDCACCKVGFKGGLKWKFLLLHMDHTFQ